MEILWDENENKYHNTQIQNPWTEKDKEHKEENHEQMFERGRKRVWIPYIYDHPLYNCFTDVHI